MNTKKQFIRHHDTKRNATTAMLVRDNGNIIRRGDVVAPTREKK